MWDLNYDDLPSLYGFNSTYSTYVMDSFGIQRRLIDTLDGITSGHIRNRAESRKHIREIHRRNVINTRIQSLLERIPMEERNSFTREELIELHRIQQNKAGYDYWPISKSVTRRLRGLVKKQKSRRIIVSLEAFLAIMPLSLNEIEL